MIEGELEEGCDILDQNLIIGKQEEWSILGKGIINMNVLRREDFNLFSELIEDDFSQVSKGQYGII